MALLLPLTAPLIFLNWLTEAVELDANKLALSHSLLNNLLLP